ncbi:MAG: phasin family protein [Pseudolabrys sp.]|nr:phasin family protein [Pseudolabrys sp.]
MIKTFEDFEKAGRDNIDLTLKSLSALSKGVQAIATEVVDYSKKTFEDGAAFVEKLLDVKSFDKAIELQSEYARNAYDGFVAKVSRLGELYVDLAKETCKPYETLLAKAK